MEYFFDVCIQDVVKMIKYHIDQIENRGSSPKASHTVCEGISSLIACVEPLLGWRLWRVWLPPATDRVHVKALEYQIPHAIGILDGDSERCGGLRHREGQRQQYATKHILPA
jgi:hypothetical protein